MPITIDGTPFSTSSDSRTTRATLASGELAHVDGDEDAERQRHQRREPDEDHRADDCVTDAASGLTERRLHLREEVEVDRRQPALEHVEDDDREDRDGAERGDGRERLHQAVDRLSPPHAPACLERDRSVRLHHADRFTENLTTMYCAITFVISEITSRIAAR